MIVYNITYAIPHVLYDDWMNWMRTTHIPEIMSTGHFKHFQIMQLMDVDETEGVTIAVQFHAKSESCYNTYLTEYAPALRLKASSVWGDKIPGFSTKLRIVQ